MLIAGTAHFINREKVKPPRDGVHVSGKDGWLKGSHAILLHGKLVPKGRVGLYYRKSEDVGTKVFYSLSWAKAQRLSYVRKICKKWKKLHHIGVAPPAEKIVRVKIKLNYRGKRHTAIAFGIRTRHIHVPEKAWEDYMYGKPYDWDCLDQAEHPLHNPKGYKAFVAWAKKKQRDHDVQTEGSYKLGDVMYCVKRKRYFLVDVD